MKVNTLLNNSWATLGITLTVIGDTRFSQEGKRSYVRAIYQIDRGQVDIEIVSNRKEGKKYIWVEIDFLVILQYSDFYPHDVEIWGLSI